MNKPHWLRVPTLPLSPFPVPLLAGDRIYTGQIEVHLQFEGSQLSNLRP